MTSYVALLRGIGPLNTNMRNEKLRDVFERLGFENVRTVISSGNVLFQTSAQSTEKLEAIVEKALPKQLRFHSTTIIRNEDEWQRLIYLDPFKNIKEIDRAKPHVTFLKLKPEATQKALRSGKGYEIVKLFDRAICYTVDLSATKTPDT
jgi:uncharacterized protein (DUF1697 family)